MNAVEPVRSLKSVLVRPRIRVRARTVVFNTQYSGIKDGKAARLKRVDQ